MHNPQSDSIKFVVRQRHGRTGKNSPAATKLQRETWSRVMTLKLLLQSNMFWLGWLGFGGFFFPLRIVCKILFMSYVNEDLHTVC